MANDPVYITFEFRGNLEDEVEKVTLGIKGLRDESAKTYQRLIADSGAAYGAMSAENRKLAVTVQESINALRDLAVVQGSLDDGLEAGTVTTRQYTRMKAALAVRENSLREAISGGMRTLNERIQTESRAVDSVMALQKRLQELTSAYYNLSKADREGNAGQGILRQIGDLDKEIQRRNPACPPTAAPPVPGSTACRCRCNRWPGSCHRSPWGLTCSSWPSPTTFPSWPIISGPRGSSMTC